MLAVGIDISKSKSVAAILNQDGSMHTSPFEFHHTQPELDAFIKYILNSNQSATILMENTGHYHYPVLKAFQEAGLPVCMVNAYQIKKFARPKRTRKMQCGLPDMHWKRVILWFHTHLWSRNTKI